MGDELDVDGIDGIENNSNMMALEHLPVFFVYVRDGEIVKVLQERVLLEMDEEEGGSFLSKRKLVEWVSERRAMDLVDESSGEKGAIKVQFRLDDILLFHFLDSTTLEDESFMQGFSILEDIELEESLRPFHDLSALYLFFNETAVVGKKKPLKILDGVVGGGAPSVVVVDVDPSHRGTRRFRHRGTGTRRIIIK